MQYILEYVKCFKDTEYTCAFVLIFCLILLTRLNLEQFMEQLKHFAVLDRDKDGFITIEDLATYLEVPSDYHLQQVFEACQPVSVLMLTNSYTTYD